MNKGTLHAQMQGPKNGAPEGEEFAHIVLAEGPSMANFDGLSRV